MAEPRFLKCSCAHCDGHIEFPDEALGVAINCPHCGKETVLSSPPPQTASKPVAPKQSGKILLLVGAAAVLAVAGGGGFYLWKSKSGGKPEPIAEKQAPTPPPEPAESKTPDSTTARTDDLQVLQFALPKAKGSGVVHVQGTVTNHAKSQYFSVKVEFDLFNKKGDKVGTTSDQLANLAPHGSWNFRALVVEKDAVTAKVASIKGEKE